MCYVFHLDYIDPVQDFFFFSPFTLIYGLTGASAQMWLYEVKLHTSVHLNVSVEYQCDEEKADICFV